MDFTNCGNLNVLVKPKLSFPKFRSKSHILRNKLILYFSFQDCTMFVAVYSNIKKVPACQVFRITHSDWTVEGVNLTPIGYLLESASIEHEHYCPELLTHEISSGHLLYAMVFKPHNFKPGKKYPTVLNVYGGPEVQLVSNTFKVCVMYSMFRKY